MAWHGSGFLGGSMVGVIVGAAALRRYYCSYRTPSSSLRNPCPRTPDGTRRRLLCDILALLRGGIVLRTCRRACPPDPGSS